MYEGTKRPAAAGGGSWRFSALPSSNVVKFEYILSHPAIRHTDGTDGLNI